jgi:hypothetical protein
MQHGARQTGQEELSRATGRRISWLTKVISVTLGMVLAGVAAYAATNWVVGLTSNSSGEAQSATISKLTITACPLRPRAICSIRVTPAMSW